MVEKRRFSIFRVVGLKATSDLVPKDSFLSGALNGRQN
jgi:hypothetical protein